jgi:hypothetical protein
MNNKSKKMNFVESSYSYYSYKLPSLKIDDNEINMISGRFGYIH